MKATVDQKALLRLVALCKPVASRHDVSSKGIANVALAVADNGLTASANNLNSAIVSSIQAHVVEDGTVTVSAAALLERVKSLPAGALQLSIVGGRLQFAAVGSSLVASIEVSTLTPPMPAPLAEPTRLSLSVATLSRLLDQTAPFASKDDSRPHVSCVLLECGSGRAKAVATDGHRLVRSAASDPGATAVASLIIPREAVGHLRRALASTKSDLVQVETAGFRAWFSVGPTRVFATLPDVKFPPYEQVIPKKRAKYRCCRQALIAAVKAVKPPSNVRGAGVRLKAGADNFDVSSVHFSEASQGAASTSVAAVVKHAGRSVGVNADYLLNALEAIGSERVVLGIGATDLDPVTVRPEVTKGKRDFVAVVMPMRL